MASTNDLKPWLPDGALNQNALAPTLLALLQEWRECWLVAGDPGIVPVYQDNCSLLPASMQWRSARGIALAWRDGSQWLLASELIGHKVSGHALQPTDRTLLGGLCDRAIDDLLARLVGRFGDGSGSHAPGTEPADPKGSVWWEVSLGVGKPVCKLAFARESLAAAIRSSMATASSPALSPLSAGLAKQDIFLAASLGRCTLSLADLKGLGIGDVLILEADADDPVKLLVNGRPSEFRASLGGESAAELTITPKDKTNA